MSKSGNRLDMLRGIHELEGILIDLADAPAAQPDQPAWLTRVLARLMEKHVRYDQIAEEIGATASTLRRRFHAAMGISPHQFVLQNRIAEARRKLGETDEPIKSIARELGYRDVYFFSRQFKSVTGVPPAMYRRSRQG